MRLTGLCDVSSAWLGGIFIGQKIGKAPQCRHSGDTGELSHPIRRDFWVKRPTPRTIALSPALVASPGMFSHGMLSLLFPNEAVVRRMREANISAKSLIVVRSCAVRCQSEACGGARREARPWYIYYRMWGVDVIVYSLGLRTQCHLKLFFHCGLNWRNGGPNSWVHLFGSINAPCLGSSHRQTSNCSGFGRECY